MKILDNFYPNLPYGASEISAFAFSVDVFILSLHNGQIIKFSPVDIAGFMEWLKVFAIRDVWEIKALYY